MKHKSATSRLCQAVIASSLMVTLFGGASPVLAADEPRLTILRVSQQDVDGDGRPDITVIDAAFVTDRDRIYVVDQGRDMAWSDDWREATDHADDIWLYDIGADGTVQLIIEFATVDGRATAYVYDDRTGDGQVAHEREGTDVRVLESAHWSARMQSDGDWYRDDGELNLNLRIELDGPFHETFERVPTNYAEEWMLHDGATDIVFEQAAGSDGIATWAMKRLITDSPQGLGFQRTGIYSNGAGTRASLPSRAFFPFVPALMDPDDPQTRDLRYFDLPPSLRVDWEDGRISSVGLDGYPIGHGYHVNSDSYAFPGTINDLSFETPHAYYDLAADGDAYPELNIRLATRRPGDPATWAFPGYGDVPWQELRYSWRLFNPGSLYWDYKVGAAGNHEIDQVVRIGDMAFRLVPHEVLPWWATERQWKMTTFVAREGDGYQSSEGLYEWEPTAGSDPLTTPRGEIFSTREAAWAYMLGASSEPPTEQFTTARPGYRAERRFSGPTEPYLYLSPIDRRLHLLGAEMGVFTIDEGQIIRYADTNGDGYLDRWQYFEEDELQRELHWTGTHLVYADEDQVRLRTADLSQSIFEALPPRDHEEWLAHREVLEDHAPNFAPQDFLAMFRQFSGPTWIAMGATLHDLRPDGDGFRFILGVEQDLRAFGSGDPPIDDLTPGRYVVSFRDSFTVVPSMPATLEARVLPGPAAAVEVNEVRVSVQNDGLEDSSDTVLELWARSPAGTSHLVSEEPLLVPGSSSVTLTMLWEPSSAGSWLLTPSLRHPDGRVTEEDAVSVRVSPPAIAIATNPVQVSSDARRVPLIAISLYVVALAAGVAVYGALTRAAKP